MPAIEVPATTADVIMTAAEVSPMRLLVAAVEPFVMTLTIWAVKIISMEVVKVIRLIMEIAVTRETTVVSVTRIQIMIHRTVESVGTMEPWACSEKGSVIEPLRSVISVGSTVVRCIPVIAIWAYRRGSTDIYTERNLCFGWGCSR